MSQLQNTYYGTAAWNLPKAFSALFPEEGTHLQRYSQVLNGVEINSSFYKEHKPATYAKWAAAVPNDFKFSVKIAKQFTHEQRLSIDENLFQESLRGISELGKKLAVLLVQIPPSLKLDVKIAAHFFKTLRHHYQGHVAFEPRHLSWLTQEGLAVMNEYGLSKVIADPEPCPLEIDKNPFSGLLYHRLHGSPEIYKSNYETDFLVKTLKNIRSLSPKIDSAWCIFDNTTFGYATANAVEMKELDRQQEAPGTWGPPPGQDFRTTL